MKTTIRHITRLTLVWLLFFGILFLQPATAAESNISETEKYAWSEKVGWINLRPSHGGVMMHDTHLSGHAWSQNIGWIKLGADSGGGDPYYANTTANNWGVNRSNDGKLSGYAWSEKTGWINFNPTHSQVTIASYTGIFDGYAWSQNVGWIRLKNIVANIGSTTPLEVSGDTHTNDTTPTWSWTTGGNGVETYRYKLDDKSWSEETTDTEYTPEAFLSQGAHTLYVQEQNAGGDWSSSGSFTIEVDSGDPCSRAASPSAIDDQSKTFIITYTYDDIYNGETCGSASSGSGPEKVELWVRTTGAEDFILADADSGDNIDGEFEYTAASEGSYCFRTIATDKAGNTEDTTSGDCDTETVFTSDFSGYAILAVGSISGNEGLEAHTITANNVYKHLIDHNFAMTEDPTDRWRDPQDHIRYFNPHSEVQTGEDDYSEGGTTSYWQAMQDAVTKWALEKMRTLPGPLYIILINHGSPDTFYLTGTNPLRPDELDEWLDRLEADMAAENIDPQPVVIILGTCYSGTFTDELSGSGRIIVTSTAHNEPSYRGPRDPVSKSQDGEFFISALFNEFGQGHDLAASFKKAVQRTELHTDTGETNRPAPYFDTARQHPHLDDNGDGVSTNDLALTPGNEGDRDGDQAKHIRLGRKISAPAPLVIADAGKEPDASPLSANGVLLWAEMSDEERTESVWAEIREPGMILEGGETQQEVDLIKVPLTLNTVNERYEGNYDDFPESGRYTVFFYARDDGGVISPSAETYIYKGRDGNSPPSAFSLISPDNDGTMRTTGVLDWEDAEDPDGDRVTYTLFLSQGDDSFDDPLKKEGLIHSVCILDKDDGIKNGSDYYWKVRAVDEYGEYRESDVEKFRTDNTNPVTARVGGYIYDPRSQRPISDAIVRIRSTIWNIILELRTDSGGYYFGELFPDDTNPVAEAEIEVSAEGYGSAGDTVNLIYDELVTKGFELNPECDNILKGDISGDCDLDLTDAVLVLQVLAGKPSPVINKDAAMNEGAEIGMAEAVYILQTLSE
ncbi:C13 family peptidase [Desulfococcaceae bacterium HSG8]|nr:C13 family peptidase [Desulfococcaceae bacterium HSG8]